MKKYAVVALLVVVLGALFGFRVEHPSSGLKNALGSASSGIVVYKKANQFAVGNKIVINTQTPETSPAFGESIRRWHRGAGAPKSAGCPQTAARNQRSFDSGYPP